MRVIILMSMQDCWSKTAEKEEPYLRELVMQNLKRRHREDGEQDMVVKWGSYGVLQERERDQD